MQKANSQRLSKYVFLCRDCPTRSVELITLAIKMLNHTTDLNTFLH